MAMNPRLLRPLAKLVAAFLLKTLAGEQLTTLAGDNLRSIQDA